MSFIVGSKELEKALQQVKQVVPSKAIIPVVTNVLVKQEGNKLSLYGTDTENSIETSVEIQPIEGDPLNAVIPPDILLRTLKELPESPITIDFNPETNNITLKTDRGEFEIQGDTPENFPPPFSEEEKGIFVMSKERLGTIIDTVLFATAKSDATSNPSMLGVYFNFKEKNLEVASTNAQQLVVYSIENTTGTSDINLLIHYKGLEMLSKLMNYYDGEEISVKYGERFVIFGMGEITLYTRLIDAIFPDYSMLITKDKNIKVLIEREELLQQLKITLAYSNKMSHLTRLVFSTDELMIKAEDRDGVHKKAEVRVNCSFSGAETPWEIAVNSQQVIDLLNHLQAENVEFRMDSPSSAIFITPENLPDSDNIIMLTMPIALAN